MASDLQSLAGHVVDYLRRENAVRVSHDEIGAFKTRWDICDALKISVADWMKVKTELLRRGISICYIPGRGHFLGFKGEQISNVVYKYKIALGWRRLYHQAREAIRDSSPEAREWIDRRFKDFKLDEEEFEYAQAY